MLCGEVIIWYDYMFLAVVMVEFISPWNDVLGYYNVGL